MDMQPNTYLTLGDEPEWYTNGHLVYVPNVKCGSTFFRRNFFQDWGWQEINPRDVGTNHLCFGHLRDPIDKRIKGQVEYLNQHGLCERFAEDPALQIAVINATYLDYHCLPYQKIFGDDIWQIDWIPIQGSNAETVRLTECLLKHYGTEMHAWNWNYEHRSSDAASHCTKILRELYASPQQRLELQRQFISANYVHDQCDKLRTLYAVDQDLWQQVIERFRPRAATWPEMSWLRSTDKKFC